MARMGGFACSECGVQGRPAGTSVDAAIHLHPEFILRLLHQSGGDGSLHEEPEELAARLIAAQAAKYPEAGSRPALLACSGCQKKLYCSKECQSAAWRGGHKTECKNMSKSKSKSSEDVKGGKA